MAFEPLFMRSYHPPASTPATVMKAGERQQAAAAARTEQRKEQGAISQTHAQHRTLTCSPSSGLPHPALMPLKKRQQAVKWVSPTWDTE